MEAKQCWECALTGSTWLLRHQRPDGSWENLLEPQLGAFYKGSWAFTLTGQPTATHRLLNHARERYMTPDGDFVPRTALIHQVAHYLYINAYFVIGSMAVGRYEIAMPAARFLAAQQDARSGGFFSTLTPPGTPGGTDTISTAAAGVACLVSGHLEAARRAGEYLIDILERQRITSNYFYTALTPDGVLDTAASESEVRWWRVIDLHAPDQCWYALGLPLAFLVLLHQASDQTRYRTAAEAYCALLERCVNPWEGPSSGKAAWGCAMLYRITGETRYREIALRVARYIMGHQEADGHWILAKIRGIPAAVSLDSVDFDVTAEYTLWLGLIASHIMARDTE
ncbi:MAG: hypothetical protein DDG58_12855 [Ardenticatenia bacterium]|jgi:hypothetical protein|nr:MAG: hypothetical protein DDG58_12855 [Ardenticatenia bacterium]